MSNRGLYKAYLACAGILCAGVTHAAPVVFTDNTFTLSNYTVTNSTLSADTTITDTQCASCGNPGQALNIAISETAGGGAFGANDALTVLINTGWTYNPATQGAIATIDASTSKNFATTVAVSFNNRFRPTILQGGVYYTAVVNGPVLTGPGATGYQTLAVTGLTANDFLQFDPATQVIGSAHPNFASGSLQLGISQFLGATAIANTTATINYDNLSLTVNAAVPEPATLAMLLTGLAGLIGLRRVRG